MADEVTPLSDDDVMLALMLHYFFIFLSFSFMYYINAQMKGKLTNPQENMSVKCLPSETPFYIEKLGFAGVFLFFLFLRQNIGCGYSPRRFYCVPTIYVLSKNKKNIKIFLLKIFILKAIKISEYCMGKFS